MTTPRDKDKEIFFVAVLYFYYMHLLRLRFDSILELAERDTNGVLLNPEKISKEIRELPTKGNIVQVFMETILKKPELQNCLQILSNLEVRQLLYDLLKLFDNQEFCASCENWSHFDGYSSSLDFSLATVAQMMALRSVWQNVSDSTRVYWFEDIFRGRERGEILEQAIKDFIVERSLNKPIAQLLPGL